MFEITKVKKVDLGVTATVDNDNSDKNEEKTASIKMDSFSDPYFLINGNLLSIVQK